MKVAHFLVSFRIVGLGNFIVILGIFIGRLSGSGSFRVEVIRAFLKVNPVVSNTFVLNLLLFIFYFSLSI